MAMCGLVARGGADGAHLTGVEALKEALPTLKPDRIAGRRGTDDAARFDDGRRSRRGLCAVRRTGCEGAAAFDRGRSPSACKWWAELFEPACVGFAASREEVFEFAAAGADSSWSAI